GEEGVLREGPGTRDQSVEVRVYGLDQRRPTPRDPKYLVPGTLPQKHQSPALLEREASCSRKAAAALPARLGDAGQLAAQGQVAQGDTGEAELAVIPARTTRNDAAVADPHLARVA